MFGIVINKDGCKVEFVCLNQDKIPQFYELKEDEKIIETDWAIANSMNKPKWDGEKWIDTEPLPPTEIKPQPLSKTEILEQDNKKLWDSVEYLMKQVYIRE